MYKWVRKVFKTKTDSIFVKYLMSQSTDIKFESPHNVVSININDLGLLDALQPISYVLVGEMWSWIRDTN